MKSNRSNISVIFGSPKISVSIVLLVIVVRFFQLQFYLDSFFDTSFQVIATQNLLEGHGISTAIVNPTDLSQPIYQPLINWPPGYSLLLAPFYAATGGNYLIACFILEMLSTITIILICRKILALLSIDIAIINLFTLITGCFIYYFYYKGSTDSLSIAFFLLSIHSLLLLFKKESYKLISGISASIFLLITAYLKYIYFPVIFIPSIFLLIYAIRNSNQQVRRIALIMICITGTGLVLLYYYQKSSAGNGVYISSPTRGFYPEHLLKAHPFIPAAFVTTNTIGRLPGNISANILQCLRVLHVMIILSLCTLAIKHCIQKKFQNLSVVEIFLYLNLIITLTISLELTGLSLFIEKEIDTGGHWWTYLEDPRYYGLGEILLHLSIFVIYGHYRKNTSGGIKYIILLLPFLLLPEALRGLIFAVKRTANYGKEIYYWENEEKFFKTGIKIADRQMKVKGTRNLVITGSLTYANYRASLKMKAPVMVDVNTLNKPASLKSREPVLILIMIKKEQINQFKPFISYSRTEYEGEFNGFYFYTINIGPE